MLRRLALQLRDVVERVAGGRFAALERNDLRKDACARRDVAGIAHLSIVASLSAPKPLVSPGPPTTTASLSTAADAAVVAVVAVGVAVDAATAAAAAGDVDDGGCGGAGEPGTLAARLPALAIDARSSR